MIVRRFLLWARHAPAGHRAEAVGALARAFIEGELAPADHAEAQTALTVMLDDPSVLVRRAMAENLGASPQAPPHIIVALASDDSEVAVPVLAHSPLLADCDLVDCAALGDERAQIAIAQRGVVSPAVSAALAEIAPSPVLVTLARNPGADIAPFSLARMIERFGAEARLCEALLARPGLPVEIAQTIAATLAETFGSYATGSGLLSAERSGRFTREARERATIALSAQIGAVDMARLVAHLRRSGQLNTGLILRALLSRSIQFVETAFADLSGHPHRRVAAILRDPHAGGFRALYGRTGMPESLRAAFEAGIAALRQTRDEAGETSRLSRPMIGHVLTACAGMPAELSGRLVATLRRLEVEAAVDEAHGAASAMADDAALAIVLRHAPEELIVDRSQGKLIAA
jgi:uncharacterized protein (DUF2336 family)